MIGAHHVFDPFVTRIVTLHDESILEAGRNEMFTTHYFSAHLPEDFQTNFKTHRRHASTYSATAHERGKVPTLQLHSLEMEAL